VRDVAGAFDLHPNVARTHLETLAEAGLVAVGRRKHPGGGRPAKLYSAREDAAATAAGEPTPGAGAALLVTLLVALLDELSGSLQSAATGASPLACRAHELATVQGRRLIAALPQSPSPGGGAGPVEFEEAVQAAVFALRPVAAAARVIKGGRDWVDVAGVRGAFGALGDLRPELAEAFERGLLHGALAATGLAATVTEAGSTPAGARILRVRAGAPAAVRGGVVPAGTVDARGQQRETGVVHAMRAITGLRSGDVLEVLAEGPGSPAAFARWADRAGHVLLGVDRATDATGRSAIRLLIRKGA
jgi:TusA-related sulfurtransferase